MPTYEYRCCACNRTFEAMHRMSAAPVQQCRLCGSPSIEKLISAPRLSRINSRSPTGATYERLTPTELMQREAPPLAAMEQQEGMKEKLEIMYSGKPD